MSETQQQEQLTPEQVEKEAWEQAASLAGYGDPQPETINEGTTNPQNEVQADPADPVQADNSGDTPSPDEVAPQEAAPPDPFAEATPAAKQAYDSLVEEKARLEHADRSNRNRISAMQRKVNDLEAKANQAVEVTKDAAPTPQTPAQQVEAPSIEGLEEFKEDFPEIYKAMNALQQQQVAGITQQFESKLAEITQQVSQVVQPVEQLQATEEDRFRQSQLEAFAQVHPDYNQIQGSQEFWDWIEAQADGVKALAGSVAASDNIALLNIYKSQHPAQQAPPQAPVQQPQQEAAPAPEPTRRQADVALPRVAAAGRLSDGLPPDDADGAWKYWAERFDEL